MKIDRRFCVASTMDRTDRHERFFLRTLSKKPFCKREKMLFFSKCEQHFAREIRARLENLNVSDKTELTLYQISNQLN